MWCGARTVKIEFDFVTHELVISVDDGGQKRIALGPMTVAAFYGEVMGAMEALGTPVKIYTRAVGGAESDPV